MSSKNVQQIKIQVATNINPTPFDLTFSKLYDPAPGERPRRINISEYPFFTPEVKYDEQVLASKTYSEIVSIFFDKEEFIKVIMNSEDASPAATPSSTPPTTAPPTPAPAPPHTPTASDSKTANENIMIMLKLLFPISYPKKSNFNTSYNKYLLKQGPIIAFDIGDVADMFSSGENTAEGKRKYSYLNTEKGVCTVTEVVLLNDILNNKLYRKLVDKLIEYNEWAKEQRIEIEKEVKTVSDKLLNGLKSPVPGSEPGELFITEEERNELTNQKRFYNPDDIKKDIMDIFYKYVDVDPTKQQEFDKEFNYMVDYFIQTHLTNVKSPITQISRVKDTFNFEYKKNGVNTDFFRLSKRYNGADKDALLTTKTPEKGTKEIELDRLENGYIDTRRWFFGKKNIEQYLENLRELIITAQSIPPSSGRTLNAPSQVQIQAIMTDGANQQLANYDRIIITPEITVTQDVFLTFNRRSSINNNSFIESVREKIDEIPAEYLTELNQKIEKLRNEIAALNIDIAELGTPNQDLFMFKGETPLLKESVNVLKEERADEITKFQKEIFKSVITRYNRFQDTRKSTELSGQYAEIDNSIDIILNELEKLNTTTIRTPETILNITEPIKNSFDKLVAANKINISRTIGTKLAEITKLSTQIKFLAQFQSTFFKDPPTGIFVEYEKKLDQKDNFTKQVIQELSQKRYSNLKNIIEYIKRDFLEKNVVSLNTVLAKIMKEYFENTSNHFYEQVVNPANELINAGKIPDFAVLAKYWDVSVTSSKSSESGSEYAISVYIELIEGELNAQNQSEIKCQILDEDLTHRFEELMDEGPSYGPIQNKEVFSIKKAKEEKIKLEKERKEEIASALGSHKKKDAPIIEPTRILAQGGKKYTKSYKTKPNNSTRKRSV